MTILARFIFVLSIGLRLNSSFVRMTFACKIVINFVVLSWFGSVFLLLR